MFEIKSPIGAIIRFCSFIQVLTVNALILYMIKAQILLLVTEKHESDSLLVNLLMNFGILILPFAFAVWYP